jgi:hypothetical protein
MDWGCGSGVELADMHKALGSISTIEKKKTPRSIYRAG